MVHGGKNEIEMHNFGVKMATFGPFGAEKLSFGVKESFLGNRKAYFVGRKVILGRKVGF